METIADYIPTWTEDDLQELLSFFRKEGKHKFLGGSMAVHPAFAYKSGNEDELLRVTICAEMEKRGLLYRHYEDAKTIIYVAVKNA